MVDVVSRFIFPTPRPSYSESTFPKELVWVPKVLELAEKCPVSRSVPCLFLTYPSARFLVLYIHSNAEDVGKCYRFCSMMREQFQVHVLAVEFPGYGTCPGGPATADSVTENAFAAFRFVLEVLKWRLDDIIVMGRSVGTGPAVSLAVQYRVSGLVLIAPFLSIHDLIRDSIGVFANLIQERFPTRERIQHIRSPILIIHGQKDTIIPCRHGTELYRLARTRKLLVTPEKMEHNTNLLSDVSYFVLPMLQFFSLPDYAFEELQMPAWAFERRPNPPQPSPLNVVGLCTETPRHDMDVSPDAPKNIMWSHEEELLQSVAPALEALANEKIKNRSDEPQKERQLRPVFLDMMPSSDAAPVPAHPSTAMTFPVRRTCNI
eukprot:gnl/TRDRNA2_/TRDRNA2_188086_c0_seq1.p1 gnl/TRDRNA2_/TRDRNA2_188086_c0~~gnl/TRDRNA2_/TRDRNA2_188086_c0_seq1.p1  ORF type:complete len:376 (-),score=57.39 gnl/TRDRNA2_/TRDRNA2_188086_c0_seq1:56-1183(-)